MTTALPGADEQISVSVAYAAMQHFLEAHWERGQRSSDEIAGMLGSSSVVSGSGPLDAAYWSDFLRAVAKAQANGPIILKLTKQ